MSAKAIDWKTLVPGGFAGENAPFGVHPCDHERAESMFHAALRAGATMNEVLREVRRHLKALGVVEEEVQRQIDRVTRFRANPIKKTRLRSAWLVTRDGPGTASEVVAILDYRKSAYQVRDFIEALYVIENYGIQEKLTYARARKNNPYPAEFGKVGGVRWHGCITCGHNPSLHGRPVTDLRINHDAAGQEKLEWKEIERPNQRA